MREYQTKLTDEAIDDISDIYNYIQKDSIYYAIKTKNKIQEKVSNLNFMPFIGRRMIDSENHNILNLREIFYISYRIIYGVNSEIIYVRRVLHSARLLFPKLIN